MAAKKSASYCLLKLEVFVKKYLDVAADQVSIMTCFKVVMLWEMWLIIKIIIL